MKINTLLCILALTASFNSQAEFKMVEKDSYHGIKTSELYKVCHDVALKSVKQMNLSHSSETFDVIYNNCMIFISEKPTFVKS